MCEMAGQLFVSDSDCFLNIFSFKPVSHVVTFLSNSVQFWT